MIVRHFFSKRIVTGGGHEPPRRQSNHALNLRIWMDRPSGRAKEPLLRSSKITDRKLFCLARKSGRAFLLKLYNANIPFPGAVNCLPFPTSKNQILPAGQMKRISNEN
jgi:hypothetical protein